MDQLAHVAYVIFELIASFLVSQSNQTCLEKQGILNSDRSMNNNDDENSLVRIQYFIVEHTAIQLMSIHGTNRSCPHVRGDFHQ